MSHRRTVHSSRVTLSQQPSGTLDEWEYAGHNWTFRLIKPNVGRVGPRLGTGGVRGGRP